MKRDEQRMHLVAGARRVVVKAGTRTLVQRSGRPDSRRIDTLVSQLAALRREGREVVGVSSGAIGAGIEALGLKTRPESLPELQMAAAVGQTRLMSLYEKSFARRRCRVGQILLTHDGLKDRERHLNARSTLLQLLHHGIVPVVNENDVVSNEEIKFGDNDLLAALVAILIDADVLILLTTTNGLREPRADGKTRRVRAVEAVDENILSLAGGTGDGLSTGGMASKLRAAEQAAHNGIPVIIADGRRRDTVTRIFAGEDVGTLLLPRKATLSKRKRWIAFFNRAQGRIVVDEGAAKAIRTGGRSLLPIGILRVEGRFPVGAMVNVVDREGALIARGLVEYGSENLERVKGMKTAQIAEALGSSYYNEAIHRDHMVVLDRGEERHYEPA
ncbi:glutamate 5-kinase [Kiritimatiella glycovorans]|uniref:Glutamate 5-kinase n=1 Tax=Kiritimatiella glycovorans TaxID=1307763 RepID=A0A0G3EM72_9BACT|nr:glutamate 5-kinase [Kiritimatiella glycovorans]AKJ65259.1 Glutamate 5-kinase [Kiritimatiella glycovorans]